MNYKHGECGTSTYYIWGNMVGRTTCKTNKQYNDYGGRGVSVCDRWLEFKNFLDDMGYRPNNLSLERIDNNKGYCKSNCKWATSRDQAENRRSNNKVIGVSWRKDKNKWRVYTSKSMHPVKSLGNFKDFFDAVCARKSWEVGEDKRYEGNV